MNERILTFVFIDVTGDSGIRSNIYETQDDCSITTGGSQYSMLLQSNQCLGCGTEEPDNEEIALFENGTTPMFALFYNELGNASSSDFVPFLDEPQVHLSCLRTVPSAKEKSGSMQTQIPVSVLGMMIAFSLCPIVSSLLGL